MEMRKVKKGFVFSIAALFLSFVVFAVGKLYIFEGDYTQSASFKEVRITGASNDLAYFKEDYLRDSIEFTLYKVLENIADNKTLVRNINQNYNKFNALVQEGLINGSLNGTDDPQLAGSNVTLSNFIDEFEESFKENYKGDFNYTLKKINLYEKQPYYVTMQVEGEYDVYVSGITNNSFSWKFNDTFEHSVPIYDLKQPKYYLEDDKNYTVRPVEFHAANKNWTYKLLNETINQVYSHSFREPQFKYTIGKSYLARLLNVSSMGAYRNVTGFWSFDYDQERRGVYDTSLYNEKGSFYADTRVYLSMDNSTYNDSSGKLEGFSAYNDTAMSYGDVDCVYKGISKDACKFNETDEYFLLENNSNAYMKDEVSVSLWFKPLSAAPSREYMFAKHNGSEGLTVSLKDKTVSLAMENDSVTHRITSEDLTLNSWTHMAGVFENSTLKLFVNGKSVNVTNTSFSRVGYGTENVSVGKHHDISSGDFTGVIDEVNLFSQKLDEEKVMDLYREKEAQYIDYKNSYLGEAAVFDGEKDFMKINVDQNVSNTFKENFTLEMWIKPYNVTRGELFSYKGEVDVWYDSGMVHVNASDAGYSNATINMEKGKNYYLAITYNGSDVAVYSNARKILNESVSYSVEGDGENLTLGRMDNNNSGYYSGEIDEVKMYNRTLSEDKIERNYYNYGGYSKGCCNYITLIPPNKLGYNDTSYQENISYSSSLFYKYVREGYKPNISLYNITNITSSSTSNPHFNFLVDICLANMFHIHDPDFNRDAARPSVMIKSGKLDGEETAMCRNLIRNGVY